MLTFRWRHYWHARQLQVGLAVASMDGASHARMVSAVANPEIRLAVLMFAPLPIAFINPRGASQYYLPWFGWALYAATLLLTAAGWISRRARLEDLWIARFRGSTLVLILIALLFPHFRHQTLQANGGDDPEAVQNEMVVTQLHCLHPTFAQGSKLLILHDPLKYDYQLMTLVRVCYNDPSLIVVRTRDLKQPPTAAQLAEYTYVMDYANGQFFDLTDSQIFKWHPLAQAPP